MKRHVIQEREGWQSKVESQGFTFHSKGLRPDYETVWGTYWYEKAYYEFKTHDYEVLKEATEELHRLCLKAVEHVAARPELMLKFGIPESYHGMICRSIDEQHPSVYGRMDLAYDGVNPPKLLEYNADTPTTLIESAVVQWNWLEDVLPDQDQFNSIHDELIARWSHLKDHVFDKRFYFATNQNSLEELATVTYLRDVADQAGINTRFIEMDNIGWNGRDFTDISERPIEYLFKLYPWEWMAKEDFGKHVPNTEVGWVEPAWKMILSNKAILPVLWEMFPKHQNLLPAYFGKTKNLKLHALGDWVEKPILGREGANITFTKHGRVTDSTQGAYSNGEYISQQRFNLPKFDDQYAVVGSWLVGDKSCGIIMREDESPIIVDRSRVVPHVFT